jgi:sialic acid synthase SpsE
VNKEIKIEDRLIGLDHSPLVIAEIGINHDGNFDKAKHLIYCAASVGCECVKFQCHIPDAEMVKSEADKIVPVNANESIYKIMEHCSFSEEQDKELKELTELYGMIYLSTPFSREAADRLERLNVSAFKIGSGECNNYPLVEHIAKKGKPIILSTGMNDTKSITPSVEILRKYNIPFALLHCTSLYPTPPDKVRLHAMNALRSTFQCVVGYSDHTLDNYACYGAATLGASILEKHFVSDKNSEGPDVSISMDSQQLKELIKGSNLIFKSTGILNNQWSKDILPEEKVTIDFAYASVVSLCDIEENEIITPSMVWVKRPGTGEIPASELNNIIGSVAKRNIKKDTLLKWSDIRC